MFGYCIFQYMYKRRPQSYADFTFWKSNHNHIIKSSYSSNLTCSSAMTAIPSEACLVASLSTIVERYSQNHKIAFLGHPMGASGAI